MVDILGPVNSLSYGNVTKEIVSGLVDLGEKVKLIPINGRIDCEINENLTKALNEKQSDTCIKIWHANDMSMPDYKTKIGWPIFELDTFTEQEKQQLKTLDKIIVCSQWAKQVVIDNGINVETEVVNLGVDDTVFFPSNNNVGEKVVFLNVGKWEVRKGHNELLWAFQDAFKDVGDVELWMACSNPFVDNSQWHNKYKRALGNKVKFVPYLYTQQELAKTINLCSIGVYPSHAEGFGLPILETLACGKPVITTNCTAQTEYCNHENCYLVESTGKVKAQDGVWFHGQGNWHSFNKKDLSNLMMTAYEKEEKERKENGRGIRNESGIATARRFSWGASCRALRRRIGCSSSDVK